MKIVVKPSARKLEEKKDACYHKVKSRYKVWPSAYASGALVKCRKVGAENWGKSTTKESREPTDASDGLTEGDIFHLPQSDKTDNSEKVELVNSL